MKRSIISILSFILSLAVFLSPLCCFAEQLDDYDIAAAGETGKAVIRKYYGSEANLVLPDSVELYETNFPVAYIADEAFIYNTDLKTIVIPEGVTDIGQRAFYGCESLETVILPSTITIISDEAFAYCTSLRQINLPDQLFFAGENIFYECNALKLTEEDKSVLANTEYATNLAQQEAFVVDTENLIELSGYLGTDFFAFVDRMGDMDDDGATSGIQYSNWDLTICGDWFYNNDEDIFISYISLNQKCNYSLMGVYVSMDAKEAMKTLLRAGWKLTDSWDIGSSFEDPNGNWISFWFDGSNSILEVCIFVSTDIIEEMYDSGRNYDFSKLFVYDDPESGTANDSYADEYASEVGSAYTTGNVNLRTGPGLGYDSAGSIPSGVYVEYLGESSVDERGVAWYYVRYNGKTGWSSSKYVELR